MKMNVIDWIGFLLVVIGSLNWGFIGAFKFNLIEFLLGTGLVTRIIYTLIGLSMLYAILLALSMKGKKKK